MTRSTITGASVRRFALAPLSLALALSCTASHEPSPISAPAPASSGELVTETAVLAGGCFWGMEHVLRSVPGVLSTEVGYAGDRPSVTYEQVSTGRTGDAEAVKIVFDPARLSYEDLLVNWFFRGHDPTTLNRQGNDVGTQYRSAIFAASPREQALAERAKQRVEASGEWGRPVVTTIEANKTFTRAEEYHQDYLVKHPHGYNDHYLRNFPALRTDQR